MKFEFPNELIIPFLIVIILTGVVILIAMKPTPVFGNQTILPPAITRSITPISRENLTSAQKKLSTDLLQLTEPEFLPPLLSLETLEHQMEQNHQLVRITVDGTQRTLVYVYISTTEHADLDIIRAEAWNVTDVDAANHLVVAWVDMENLTNLASFDTVRSIRTVMPPITQRY
jgi:hypothetical protein